MARYGSADGVPKLCAYPWFSSSITHTCRTAGPGPAEPDLVLVGPGTRRLLVLVHAARISGRATAVSSHGRFFTISTRASSYVTVNHAGGGLA